MAYSATQVRSATDSVGLKDSLSLLQEHLTTGILIERVTMTSHRNQYMNCATITFQDGTRWVFFGEDGNTENWIQSIRGTYYKITNDSDKADGIMSDINTHEYVAHRVKEIQDIWESASKGAERVIFVY